MVLSAAADRLSKQDERQEREGHLEERAQALDLRAEVLEKDRAALHAEREQLVALVAPKNVNGLKSWPTDGGTGPQRCWRKLEASWRKKRRAAPESAGRRPGDGRGAGAGDRHRRHPAGGGGPGVGRHDGAGASAGRGDERPHHRPRRPQHPRAGNGDGRDGHHRRLAGRGGAVVVRSDPARDRQGHAGTAGGGWPDQSRR
jgi:hypothetical protein